MSVPEDEVETAEIEARKQHPREDLLDGAALGDAVLDTLPRNIMGAGSPYRSGDDRGCGDA